jgi:hypothetical protein
MGGRFLGISCRGQGFECEKLNGSIYQNESIWLLRALVLSLQDLECVY